MKKTGCVILALFVAICASMFLNLLLVSALGVKGATTLSGSRVHKEKSFEEEFVASGESGEGKIVVIPLVGVIGFGQAGALGDDLVEDFKIALDQADKDDEVKAVVISVDSPGGEVTASDVLLQQPRRIQQKEARCRLFQLDRCFRRVLRPAVAATSCRTPPPSPVASA